MKINFTCINIRSRVFIINFNLQILFINDSFIKIHTNQKKKIIIQ